MKRKTTINTEHSNDHVYCMLCASFFFPLFYFVYSIHFIHSKWKQWLTKLWNDGNTLCYRIRSFFSCVKYLSLDQHQHVYTTYRTERKIWKINEWLESEIFVLFVILFCFLVKHLFFHFSFHSVIMLHWIKPFLFDVHKRLLTMLYTHFLVIRESNKCGFVRILNKFVGTKGLKLNEGSDKADICRVAVTK